MNKLVILLAVVLVTANANAGRRHRHSGMQSQGRVMQSQGHVMNYGHQNGSYTTQQGGGDPHQLLNLINNYRAQNGRSPLSYDPRLNMSDGVGRTGHGNFHASGMSGRANWSPLQNPQQVFNQWKKNGTGPHNANMLAEGITRAGFGFGNGTTFTAQ